MTAINKESERDMETNTDKEMRKKERDKEIGAKTEKEVIVAVTEKFPLRFR